MKQNATCFAVKHLPAGQGRER